MKTKIALGQLRALPDNVDETRTIQFIISSERKDRHGTVLDLEGWALDSYNNNPIVGYQHDVYGDSSLKSPDPDSVIGKGRVFREANQLVSEVTFEPADMNPLAEKIFKKVKFGTLRTASVGFLPISKGRWGTGEEARGGENQTYYYGKRELLEWSIVNIPSNADALRRQLEDIPEEEIEDGQKCEKCGHIFNPDNENEAGMGYVKCPKCGHPMDSNESLKNIEDTSLPTSVPDDEMIRVRFELTKIL